MTAATRLVRTADVRVGDRSRKDHGDIDALAASLRDLGMLQPIGLTPGLELVFGGRRLAAAMRLGWEEIPATVLADGQDAARLLRAERDENTCREPMKPSELVALGRRIEELERPKAKKRQGTRTDLEHSGNLPECSRGDTRDKVADAIGVGTRTYDKMKAVAEAAEANPEKYGDLPAKMDAESVDAAHRELKARGESHGNSAPEIDAWGIPIQPHAAEAFAAVPRFRELIRAIAHAQKLFNEVANLPGGKFLTLPDVSSYRRGKKLEDGTHADRFVHEGLEAAIRQVKAAIPTHTVCPYSYAEAAHPADCPCCKNLNWTPVLGKSVPDACRERAVAELAAAEEEQGV